MQLLIIHIGNQQHSVMHAFIMFIISLTEKIVTEVKCTRSLILWRALIHNQLCRCNVPPNHRPACSLISQQHCYPQAGHDSPRNMGTTGLHIAKDTQNTQSSPTELGLSGHLGAGEGKLLSWWAHYRAKSTYTRTSLTSKTPKHTQHKESVPSLLHGPSGPAFPSSAI